MLGSYGVDPPMWLDEGGIRMVAAKAEKKTKVTKGYPSTPGQQRAGSDKVSQKKVSVEQVVEKKTEKKVAVKKEKIVVEKKLVETVEVKTEAKVEVKAEEVKPEVVTQVGEIKDLPSLKTYWKRERILGIS
jgi:hypothetical protein